MLSEQVDPLGSILWVGLPPPSFRCYYPLCRTPRGVRHLFFPPCAPGRAAVFCPPCAPRRAAVLCPLCAPRRAAGFCPVSRRGPLWRSRDGRRGPARRPPSPVVACARPVRAAPGPRAARTGCVRPARDPYGRRQTSARPVRAAPGPRAARAAWARLGRQPGPWWARSLLPRPRPAPAPAPTCPCPGPDLPLPRPISRRPSRRPWGGPLQGAAHRSPPLLSSSPPPTPPLPPYPVLGFGGWRLWGWQVGGVPCSSSSSVSHCCSWRCGGVDVLEPVEWY
ncbi:unnamed protein product [Closterium sp. NIES-53]